MRERKGEKKLAPSRPHPKGIAHFATLEASTDRALLRDAVERRVPRR